MISLCKHDGGLRRRPGEHYTAGKIIDHEQFAGWSVMVWGAISTVECTDLYGLGNGTLTARYQDEILAPTVSSYAGAMGPTLLPGLM